MTKDIIKCVLTNKLKLIDEVTKRMPSQLKENVIEFQHDILSTVVEVANEYMDKNKIDKDNKDDKDKKELKKVQID